MRRILCIRFPGWPVMRLRAARPELKNRPIVLYETARNARRVLAWRTANNKALSRGMPLGEAVSLVGSSAKTLHLEEYDPVADREALAKLAAWCGRFSPLLGIEDAATPDSLLLDVTGIAHFFGGEVSLADRVVGDFSRRGLTVHLGLADTLGAAWAVAHFGQSAPSIVADGEIRAALDPLPVEALRLSGEVVDLLHQLGVYWIGQLERLPRADFASRFGPRLIERLDQAMGQISEPIPAHHLPPEFEAHRALEDPTAHRKTIECVLEQLITEVAQKLLHGGRGVVRLACRFDCRGAGKVDFDVGLFQASASAEHLTGLAQTRLGRLLLPGPVSAIHVAAAITAVFQPRQEEFFDDGTLAKRGRELAGLVDRLSSRLGRRSVLGVRLMPDAQPELAYSYVAMVDGILHRYRRGNLSRRDKMAKLPPRPLRLFQRPRDLAGVSIAPDGRPLGFQLHGSEHSIARSWGPERIETGWWRGRRIGRDYYRVETTTGRRYWLFRKLRDGRWFMHGEFE